MDGQQVALEARAVVLLCAVTGVLGASVGKLTVSLS
jgi:hypothetical protein